MPRKTAITLNITLDDNHTPEKMHWSAPDGGVKQQPMEAFFLSTWDKETQESARIDLWSKEMPVDQMQVFVHQTLLGLRESYLRATEDVKMAEAMQQFCDFFASERNLKQVKKNT